MGNGWKCLRVDQRQEGTGYRLCKPNKGEGAVQAGTQQGKLAGRYLSREPQVAIGFMKLKKRD